MNKSLKAMADFTFISRYARYNKEKKKRFNWNEAVGIVEQMHHNKYDNMHEAIKERIEWAFKQVQEKRVLGSQRALQYGGLPIERKNARLYNCTVSYADRARFFQEAFWLLLCGCGVGFSVQKHHVEKMPAIIPSDNNEKVTYVVEDTIEGWADALGVLLSSFFDDGGTFPEYKGKILTFDYSMIRPKGSKLSSGAGKAPGPEGLKSSLNMIQGLLVNLLRRNDFKKTVLRPIDVYDIVMHASDAVLSGGVRRSATICLFSADDEEMAMAKTGDWSKTNPQRARSNNSALLIRGTTTFEQFQSLMKHVKEFGEPGFVWSDSTELLVNPCVEIGMMAYETFLNPDGSLVRNADGSAVTGRSGWQFCNLCEINGRKVRTIEDFRIAATAAAIIGTLQAGYTDVEYLGPVSKSIIEREALLGVSITGMMDNPDIIFDPNVQQEMAKLVLDVNEEIAAMIGVNPCARASCIKPSGSTSLILGTASGVHPHHAKKYFRRMQVNKMEAPLYWFRRINPRAVEESVWSANKTDDVITFCIEVSKDAKTKNQISAIELLKYIKSTQENWVIPGTRKERCTAPWLRHNVSNTIHVKDTEWDMVTQFVYDNREYFAGISLLSINGDKDYHQAPLCTVYTSQEIEKEYGDGALMASGLIVDGLRCFGNNLWAACQAVMNTGETLDIETLRGKIKHDFDAKDNKYWVDQGLHAVDSPDRLLEAWLKFNVTQIDEKRDWVRRAKQFAKRYFKDDIKKMTYCLKDVYNLKQWIDLTREYKEVDYSDMYEEDDDTKISETIACAGGSCEII